MGAFFCIMAAKLWSAGTSNAVSTTLNGNVAIGDTSIVLTSVTGLQAPGVLVIDRVNSSGTSTPSTREYISFTGISSFTLTGCSRGLGGSSAQSHSSGAIVEETISITHWNDMVSFMNVAHTSDGTIATASTATIAIARIYQFVNASGATGTISDMIIPRTLYASGATGTITNLYVPLTMNVSGASLSGFVLDSTNSAITARAIRSLSTDVVTSGATAPSSGQVLTATSSTAANWQTPSAGSSAGHLQSIQTSDTVTDSNNTTTTYETAIAITWTPTSAADIVVTGFLNWYGTVNEQAKMRIALDGVAMGADPSAFTDFPATNKAFNATVQQVSTNIAASSHTVSLQFAQNVGSSGVNINTGGLKILVFNHV